MNTNRWVLLTLGIILWIGCSDSKPERPASPPAPSSPPQTGNVPPPPPPPPVANTAPSAQPTPNTTQKKAVVGVGVKGHYGGEGFVVTPIASLFAVRERMVFEVQIPEAMKLFKAMEDRVPKSHEEFMERIIKEQHIKLPELPEGSRYLYDPKRGELMVESPSPQP